MKLVVVSDSHGESMAINKIFNNYDFDHLIFLGDGVDDLGCYADLPNVTIVRGNCDFFSDYPVEQIIEFEGVKIMATHGHKYGVKSTLGLLANEAITNGINLVFYGHTHIANDIYVQGVRLINPGSVNGKGRAKSSFAIVELDKQKILVKHVVL